MFIGIEEVKIKQGANAVIVTFQDLIIDGDYYLINISDYKSKPYSYALKALKRFIILKNVPVCYTDFYGDE